MSKQAPELLEAFRAADLRPTAQRRAVPDFPVSRRRHATAGEILRAVHHAGSGASRATVYNSLRALSRRAGLVREVFSGGTSARFDATLHPHHHFLCERCGAIEDLDWLELPALASSRALGGRRVRCYEVIVRGCCRKCGNLRSRRGVH